MKKYPDRIAMIADLPEGSSGVEVGVLRGDFSIEMLSTGKIDKLLLVDSWTHSDSPEYHLDPANYTQDLMDILAVYVNMRFHEETRVSIMRMTSFEAAVRLWPKRFDFVYIDAAHYGEYPLQDLFMWSQMTNRIFCHDYTQRQEALDMKFTVFESVNRFLEKNPQWEMTGISDVDGWPTCRLEKFDSL